MEFINFDENDLRNQSFKRNINHLYSLFYDDNNSFQIVSIGEYYEANKDILNSYNNGSLRDRIEIVPLIYKMSMLPSDTEYSNFRSSYFKQIILSYLFGQSLSLNSYRINKENRVLVRPNASDCYNQMVDSKMDFNGSIVLKEELIKFLFRYYLKEIGDFVKNLNDNQPDIFNNIKSITYRNVQPSNITMFMNVVIANYKRIIELYHVYNSDDIKRKNDIEELMNERDKLIKQIKKINDKIGDGYEKGKKLSFSSGRESAKLFMYDNEGGFIQNLLFTFLVGLTSGLSFFFVSSLIKFILNRI